MVSHWSPHCPHLQGKWQHLFSTGQGRWQHISSTGQGVWQHQFSTKNTRPSIGTSLMQVPAAQSCPGGVGTPSSCPEPTWTSAAAPKAPQPAPAAARAPAGCAWLPLLPQKHRALPGPCICKAAGYVCHLCPAALHLAGFCVCCVGGWSALGRTLLWPVSCAEAGRVQPGNLGRHVRCADGCINALTTSLPRPAAHLYCSRAACMASSC